MADEKKINLREGSKEQWVSDRTGSLTVDEISLGATLRIADSLETIAKNKEDIENSLIYYKNRCKRKQDRIFKLERSNAAYRGHITRLKNKIKT